MADSIYEWRFDPRLNIRRLVLRADPDRLTDAERAELAAAIRRSRSRFRLRSRPLKSGTWPVTRS